MSCLNLAQPLHASITLRVRRSRICQSCANVSCLLICSEAASGSVRPRGRDFSQRPCGSFRQDPLLAIALFRTFHGFRLSTCVLRVLCLTRARCAPLFSSTVRLSLRSRAVAHDGSSDVIGSSAPEMSSAETFGRPAASKIANRTWNAIEAAGILFESHQQGIELLSRIGSRRPGQPARPVDRALFRWTITAF
jgi:hypothetical protein